jgi:hypothetical protein
MVTTVELLSVTPGWNRFDQRYERESNSSPYLIEESARRYENSSTADFTSTNLRVDFRYRRSSNTTSSFVAQLGAGMTWFSSKDVDIYLGYLRDYRASSFNTYEFSYSMRTTLEAAPGGFGSQVSGGVGWSFQQNNFLFAIAALARYQRSGYDDVAYSETKYERPPFPALSLYEYSVPYDFASSQYRVALPLGMEYQARKLSLRAGWVSAFRGETYEANSQRIDETNSRAAGNNFSSHRLDVSTVTVGMGYQILDQLRADLLNFGNLSEPQDWSVSVIYSF